MVGRAGFEPAKVKPADLQSAAFDRFAIDPEKNFILAETNPSQNKNNIFLITLSISICS